MFNESSIPPEYIELAKRELQQMREEYRAARARENACIDCCDFSSIESRNARESRVAWQNRLFGFKTALFYIGIIDHYEYCAD